MFRNLVYQLRHSPLVLAGLVGIALLLVLALVPQVFASHDPNALNLAQRLAPPSAEHWAGTDEVGRDLLSRLIYGTRISLGAAVIVVSSAVACGLFIGAGSAILGGWVDLIVMRAMDVFLSVPPLVMAMALAAALGPNLVNSMLAIAIVRIPFYVRLVRGQALAVRERSFVAAARTFGASDFQLATRHIIPNVQSALIVQATLDIGMVILAASALSFIGLGAQPPTPEWGALVSKGRAYMLDQWWYAALPGVTIVFAALSFNLVGDGLRDILDPKTRKR
jgi:peptide/nickel transport system permease protein